MSESKIPIKNKIFPRNLTARARMAAERVIGNPANTRLESGVANCFPGLEFDVRGLDARFFPGLLFRFVVTPLDPDSDAIADQQGVRLLYIDLLDPMLPETSGEPWVQELRFAYDANGGDVGRAVVKGRWYLDWIEQHGKRLSMTDPQGNYYSCEVPWRYIRGLSPGPVRIGIVRRDAPEPKPRFELAGERRRFVNDAGVYDLAYRPGELTETMCNPWSHDFRDCACHYWASNHPDVVVRDLADAKGHAGAAKIYVDWLSVIDRSATLPASGTIGQNRPFQIDHYEINQKWEKLPFILQGREITEDYRPRSDDEGKPYGSDQELLDELQNQLAPLELTLALQYLYALFSLRDPASTEICDQEWPGLRADLKAIRETVMLVAVGEMDHLRWVNEMLWELDRAGIRPNGRPYSPVLKTAKTIPTLVAERRLQPLDPKTLDFFIAIERPSGAITRAYSRCVATLRHPKYPPVVYELAKRIDGEGTDHYERFLSAQRILRAYDGKPGNYPYLRSLQQGRRDQPECRRAVALLDELLEQIRQAYTLEARKHLKDAQTHIDAARRTMLTFRDEAEALAERGIGVPFWDD